MLKEGNKMKKYNSPELEIIELEAEDIITISVGNGPVEGGEDGWMDI